MTVFAQILVVLFLSSCASRSPYNINVMGIEEFAEESRLANEGKFSIQELEGKITCVQEGSLEEFEDLIVDDDILTIVVYHPTRHDLMESISGLCERIDGFKVQNGFIQLPGFNKIYVTGLTLNQAKEKIREELQNQISNIDVFITFRERPSNSVEVSGMAVLAQIPVDGKTRLFEILAKAKIPSSANLHASYVLRDEQFVKVDLVRLIKNGDMTQNIVMRPNDKIYIASPQD